MKKNLMVVVAFVLIFTHIISPQNISFANDEVNECESMDFTVQTIKENDEKINGTAKLSQKLEVEFKTKGKTEIMNVDSGGEFELEVDAEFLDLNDAITISNDYFKIETKVTSEEKTSTSLQSEQHVDCTLIKETSEDLNDEAESSTTEKEIKNQTDESVEEETTSKAGIEAQLEESLGEDSIEEAETKEQLEEFSEADSTEEAETKEQPEESMEEGSTEEAEMKEQPEDSVEEDSTEEAEMKEQPEESVEEETIPRIETEESLEEYLTEEVETKGHTDTEEEIAETFSVLSQDQTQKIYQSSSAPIDTIRGSSVTVITSKQFNDAISDNNIEHIRLSNNINTSGILNVRTRYGQKVIDANGYSINIGSGQMSLSSSPIPSLDVRKFIILNASNLYTSNASDDGGMIKKRYHEVSIHLENVSFNANNDSFGGILGSSWEADINFYGNNIINTYKGEYSMAFRKAIIHQGAEVKINNCNGSSVFQFERNTRTYGDGEYGIQIDTNGTLDVNSNAAVITSNLSRAVLRDRILTNRFGIDSNVILSGTGSNIFPVDTTVNNFITNPEKLNFINNQSKGTLFNSSEEINFYLSETTLKGWNGNNMEDQASNISQPITEGQFSFSGKNTTNVSLTPSQYNFTTIFTPQLRRIEFEKPIPPIEVLEVAEITDNSTEITGATSANVSVTMSDENGNIIQTVESNSNGAFVFELEEPFEVATVLQFQAQNRHVESGIVKKTVIGNRLELINVPDSILFEITEIQDEEIIIEREKTNMTVSVLDTRSNSDWYLTARALAPLTDSESNNTLDGALYYIEGDNKELIEDKAVRVGEKNQSSDNNLQELSWSNGEGIILKLNPIQAQADIEYTTIIEWTLNDGP